MTGWRIDPAGVQQVLETVRAAQAEIAKDLESGDLEPVARAVTMPAEGSSGLQNGVTGSVMAALNSVFESEADNIATIQSHILAGLFGVANATHEYSAAQQSMAEGGNRFAKAAEMQSAMFESATSGDFGYFTEHGRYHPDPQR